MGGGACGVWCVVCVVCVCGVWCVVCVYILIKLFFILPLNY
jgi:hypothetical protein